MKPILFNTEKVQAILEDRKTVTRRLIKPQPDIDLSRKHQIYSPVNQMHGLIKKCGYLTIDTYIKFKAPFKPGDILYVRETWCNVMKPEFKPEYEYFADTKYAEDYDSSEWKWHPSIHMPKEAARIFLRVKAVKVEKLQDITEEQAKMEGVKKSPFQNPTMRFAEEVIRKENRSAPTYINGFKETWFDTLPKCYTDDIAWEGNPWVWVIEFEQISKEEEDLR